MATADTRTLEDYSQVSTGRGCNFCKLGIRDTKWLSCSCCFAIDCCLNCFNNQETMPLVLEDKLLDKLQGKSTICSNQVKTLSAESKTKLPHPLKDSPEVCIKEHVLKLYAYHARMESASYRKLTKDVRDADYLEITSRGPNAQFNRRDVTILMWKLEGLGSDTSDPTVNKERASIYELLGKIYSQPNRTKILTLDGGGTRGYLTIRVLEEAFKLMAEKFPDELRNFADDSALDLELVEMGEHYKNYMCLQEPAYLVAQKYFMQQFDTIVGTSTGALIGFCLAVEIPLYRIRELYANVGTNKFFTKNTNVTSWLGNQFPFNAPKYTSLPIEAELIRVLDSLFEDRDTLKLRLYEIIPHLGKGPSKERRQLVINAFDMGHNKIINFNTEYKPHHHYGIFDILRGAMAGELYFAPHKPLVTTYSNNMIDQYLVDSLYVDAGIYANDPTLIALYIARLNKDRLPSTVYVVLGIGTGVHDSTFPTHEGIGGGGIYTWIKGQSSGPKIEGGLLPNTCMEATRSFTEIVASDLGRTHTVRRFKYNLHVPNAVALDDLKFKSKVDAAWSLVETSTDMKALRSFIMNYITPVPEIPPIDEEDDTKSSTTVVSRKTKSAREEKQQQTQVQTK